MEVEMTGTRQVGAPRIVRIGRAGTPRGAVVLGGPTRIIAPILGADREALDAEMRLLAGPGGASVDLVEWRVDPLLAALPGVLIFLTSMCFNLISDGLRSAMDVRLKL